MEVHRSDVEKGAGPTQTIRCRLLEVGEEVRVDVRVHLMDIPGAGFTLAPERLPALIAALRHTEAAARKHGLIAEEA
jgi:hypothetical protein